LSFIKILILIVFIVACESTEKKRTLKKKDFLDTPIPGIIGVFWRPLYLPVTAFLGFRNRIGASEPFLSQRFVQDSGEKKNRAVTRRWTVLPGAVNNSRKGSIYAYICMYVLAYKNININIIYSSLWIYQKKNRHWKKTFFGYICIYICTYTQILMAVPL
jgi:hypothetical protein